MSWVSTTLHMAAEGLQGCLKVPDELKSVWLCQACGVDMGRVALTRPPPVTAKLQSYFVFPLANQYDYLYSN